MLDKREIRENPDAVRAAVRVKGIDLDVDELLQLDKLSRELQHELDQTQATRKSSASGAVRARTRTSGDYLRSLRHQAEPSSGAARATGGDRRRS